MLSTFFRKRIDNLIVYYPIRLGRNFFDDPENIPGFTKSSWPIIIKNNEARHTDSFFLLTIFLWIPFLLLVVSTIYSKAEGESSLRDWFQHLSSLGNPQSYISLFFYKLNMLLLMLTGLTVTSAVVNTCHWISIKFSSHWTVFTSTEIFWIYTYRLEGLDFWRPRFTTHSLLKENIEYIEVNQAQYNDYFFYLLRWMDFWPKMTTWEMIIKLKTPVISPPNDLPLTEEYYRTRISIGNISSVSLEFFLKLLRQALPNIEIQLS